MRVYTPGFSFFTVHLLAHCCLGAPFQGEEIIPSFDPYLARPYLADREGNRQWHADRDCSPVTWIKATNIGICLFPNLGTADPSPQITCAGWKSIVEHRRRVARTPRTRIGSMQQRCVREDEAEDSGSGQTPQAHFRSMEETGRKSKCLKTSFTVFGERLSLLGMKGNQVSHVRRPSPIETRPSLSVRD